MLKRTPLYDDERLLGAKFTEFAGWELPLYYSSIIDEHMAVRTSAGIFDITYLGKVTVKGDRALEFLQFMITNNIENIPIGKGVYTLFCNEDGGIIDDEILYRIDRDEYLLIPNAARVDTVLEWFMIHKPPTVEVRNRTGDYSLIALQGPHSGDILAAVFNVKPDNFRRYSVKSTTVNGNKITIMKSGYTGEEGYEILSEPYSVENVWRAIIEKGARPSGLAARDTLRLEMGYPLYGRDITTDTTPFEAGLEKFVSLNKGDFIGRNALNRQVKEGVERKLRGFVLDGGIARGGESVFSATGEKVGRVTSAGYSPILRKGIGMAYIKTGYPDAGNDISVKTAKKMLSGRITEPPFVIVHRRS